MPIDIKTLFPNESYTEAEIYEIAEREYLKVSDTQTDGLNVLEIVSCFHEQDDPTGHGGRRLCGECDLSDSDHETLAEFRSNEREDAFRLFESKPEAAPKTKDKKPVLMFRHFSEAEAEIERRIFCKHSRMIKDRDGIGHDVFTWFGHDCKLQVIYNGADHSISFAYKFQSAPQHNFEQIATNESEIRTILDKVFGNI